MRSPWAYWLQRYGFTPTLVERAPRLRTGGYIIDFWGAGFDVAERMGLIPQLLQQGYPVEEVRQVDRNGQRASGFPISAFNRVTGGRFTSLPRGELAASIYQALGNRVETLFDDSIASLEDLGGEVRVRFEHSRLSMFLRNQVMKLMAIPFVAELAVGRELRDTLELPEY